MNLQIANDLYVDGTHARSCIPIGTKVGMTRHIVISYEKNLRKFEEANNSNTY